MNSNSLIYAFYRYIKSIDKEMAKSIELDFCGLNNDSNRRAYEIAIGTDGNFDSTKIFKLLNILAEDNKTYYSFKELSIDKDFINHDTKENSTVDRINWTSYMNKILKKLREKKNDFEKIYYLFMKYLSNVPAVNTCNSKVSLFDICKLTSAIENCLKKDYEKLILIKGDLSGIQNFIYKTQKSSALKMLKGRSLYISILQDLVAKLITKKLNLSIANILYSGGGNFYILASAKDLSEFQTIKKYISKVLLKAHDDELYIALGYSEFNINEIDQFSDVWKNIGSEVGKVKSKRWSELGLYENYDEIFGPLDNGGVLEESCKLCGKICSVLNEDGLCEFCNSFIEFIEEAQNKRFYKESFKDIDINKEKIDIRNLSDVFKLLGFSISFDNDRKINNVNEKIYSINDLENEDVDGYVFKSIKLPKKSLDNIAKSDGELGDNKIGVIKLDVDNLGKLFISTKNIGEVMALSRNISIFFEGFVEQAIYNNYFYNESEDDQDIYVDKIVIIYAGGDDTFIVGRYDESFKFIDKLKKTFDKYVDNRNRTFSVGVGMFGSNYPIIMAATKTEEFLEKAKKLEGKNRICFLGETFTWNQFTRLIELKDLIEKIYINSKSKSIFQKIDNSTKGFKSVLSEGKSINYLKMYRLAYYLRDLKSNGNEKLVENLVEQYEKMCIEAVKERESKNNEVMIIPYANVWARCNCRILR